MKALIADDSEVMRAVIQRELKVAGYPCEAVEASDGIEALAKLDVSIDIVFIDWNMPKKNGIEVIKEIRKNGNTVPIIMISMERTEEGINEALREGASGYIVKPFTAEKIKEKLMTILNS
ncbi:MAG: response regulator [Candidatus Omnitrophica bacterium]|nr:response regulator [Candidatus Omnitrophota bacterium]